MDVALDSAMRCFWERGYVSTSLAQLVTETGVNRASLYGTFGGKRELFLAALKRYDRIHREAWFSRLAARLGPKRAVMAAFDEIMSQAGESGCMLVNTALEMAPHDDEIRELVAGAFESAELFFHEMVSLCELDDVERRTATLLGLFLGVRVLARSRPDPGVFRGVRAEVANLLEFQPR